MKIASIDIGSNTVLLLIAEISKPNKELTPLLNEYRIPRISEGLEKSHVISDKKVEELIKILDEYQIIINSCNCDHIIVNATNAFRIATNADQIMDLIIDSFKLNVNVLSGFDEAYLSFLGARSSFTSTRDIFVLDIGGGSTEIIYGDDKSIIYRKSFNRGAVNFTEELINKYPINRKYLKSVSEQINKYFAEIRTIKDSSDSLISVAGTPTSLSCINKNITTYDDDLIEGSILTQEEIVKIIYEMSPLHPQEILSKYGSIVEGREDVILTGSIILSEVMSLLDIKKTVVSSRGLRYGAVIKFIEDLQ